MTAKLGYFTFRNMINSLLRNRNCEMNDLKFLFMAALVFVVACSSPPKNNNAEETKETQETTAPVAEVNDALVIGEKIYGQYCVVCHMKDGAGIPGLNPPLIKTEWVNGDKAQLIKIVLNGSQGGQYPVNGEAYPGVMTPHNFLSDEEIAGVLSFVRSNFENNSDAVMPGEVAAAREANSG